VRWVRRVRRREEVRWETRVSFSVLSSLPQLVDGQCQISLQKAEFQGVLEKLNISTDDLPGLRLLCCSSRY
jgi:hypothetical protein